MVSVIKAFEQRGHCKPSHRIGPVPRHFGERREDEPALPEPGMRDDQPRRTVDRLARVKNQIEVQRPRRAGCGRGRPNSCSRASRWPFQARTAARDGAYLTFYARGWTVT